MLQQHYPQLTVKDASEQYTTISGYASVFSVIDQHNDLILPKAFQASIAELASNNQLKLLWQHEPDKPIGLILLAAEDSYGLWIEAAISTQTQAARETIALIKQKVVSGLSVGIVIKEAIMHPKGYRQIIAADLWEVSVVTFPANTCAYIQQTSKCASHHALDAALIKATNNLQQLLKGNL